MIALAIDFDVVMNAKDSGSIFCLKSISSRTKQVSQMRLKT